MKGFVRTRLFKHLKFSANGSPYFLGVQVCICSYFESGICWLRRQQIYLLLFILSVASTGPVGPACKLSMASGSNTPKAVADLVSWGSTKAVFLHSPILPLLSFRFLFQRH